MDMISRLKNAFGFKKTLTDIITQMRDGEIQLVASSLSFTTIVAFIPFIAVVLATLQTVGGGLEVFYPKVEQLFLQNLRQAVGGEAVRIVRLFLNNINAGRMGSTGAAFLILTSLRLLHDMESGIHRVWNMKISRRFYKRLLFYWFLIFALPVAMVSYVSLISLEEVAVVRRLMPKTLSDFLFLWGLLLVVYKWVPDIKVNWKPSLISSALAAVGMIGALKGLGWAAVQLFSYNRIYGSFAAIPLLLVWVLTIWYIILGGVAVCASLQKRRG